MKLSLLFENVEGIHDLPDEDKFDTHISQMPINNKGYIPSEEICAYKPAGTTLPQVDSLNITADTDVVPLFDEYNDLLVKRTSIDKWEVTISKEIKWYVGSSEQYVRDLELQRLPANEFIAISPGVYDLRLEHI